MPTCHSCLFCLQVAALCSRSSVSRQTFDRRSFHLNCVISPNSERVSKSWPATTAPQVTASRGQQRSPSLQYSSQSRLRSKHWHCTRAVGTAWSQRHAAMTSRGQIGPSADSIYFYRQFYFINGVQCQLCIVVSRQTSSRHVTVGDTSPRRAVSLPLTWVASTPLAITHRTGAMLLSSSSCRHGDQPRQTMTSPTDTDNVRSSL